MYIRTNVHMCICVCGDSLLGGSWSFNKRPFSEDCIPNHSFTGLQYFGSDSVRLYFFVFKRCLCRFRKRGYSGVYLITFVLVQLFTRFLETPLSVLFFVFTDYFILLCSLLFLDNVFIYLLLYGKTNKRTVHRNSPWEDTIPFRP